MEALCNWLIVEYNNIANSFASYAHSRPGLRQNLSLDLLFPLFHSHVLAMSQVFVRTLTGKIITIELDWGATIADLKERIRDKEGVPPEMQRLIVGGKCPPDE
jgi:hypothetical protein